MEQSTYIKHKNSGVAVLLSFLWPGLGQLYNGQIFKGLIFGFAHLIFGLASLAITSGKPSITLAFAAFWVYGMWDAHHIAEAFNNGQPIGQWRGFLLGLAILIGGWIGSAILGGIVSSSAIQSKQGPFQSPLAKEQTYIPNLLIEDIRVGEGYGQFDMPGYSPSKPTINAKLRNIGNQTVKSAEVTVYFFNKQGQKIAEKNYTPVNEYALLDNSGPLKPNYVKEFGYVLDANDVPLSEWNKRVEIVVSSIKLED